MIKIFKMIVLTAISMMMLTACDSSEEPQMTDNQAQEFNLPETITIVSAEEMPEVVMTRATTNVTAYDVAGTYNGLLYDVNMNGNDKDDVQNLKIDITAQGNNKFRFYLRPFKVGNMPAHLSVDIKDLRLNSDGTFHAENVSTLKVGWFKYPVTLIDGSFTPVAGGHRLRLTLESEGTFFSISIFKAHVKYDGEQQ